MKDYTSSIPSCNFKVPPCGYNDNEILYFDIETTGFSPAGTYLYLIGCAYYRDGGYCFRQFFLDDTADEKAMIEYFIDFIHNFKCIIHYNGSGFDIPYIIRKCEIYNIPCDFTGISSLDIYKTILPVKSVFNLENLKQKTVERFMGIEREDKYSGGELINIYNEYIRTKNDELLSLLLMHNHDDVCGMINISDTLSYAGLINDGYTFESIEMRDSSALGTPRKEAVITCRLTNPVPERVSAGNDRYYFTAYSDILRICITAYTSELKYFYPDYKNYYYLPKEDRSIHKSVAFYVDKNYRTRAKAANCYSRKTGLFLPQSDEIVSPYFKIDYYDKITYFEYLPEFTQNPELILRYVRHILRILIQ